MRRILPLFFLLAACAPTRDGGGGDPPPPDSDRPGLGFGWSFGMCGGECLSDLVLAPDGAVTLETSGWGGELYTVVTGTAQEATEEAVDAAWEALDREALQQTYGCPDCADGGAEYASFDDGLAPARSTWEWGNPPPELQALWDVLHPLLEAMRACDDGDGYDQDECLMTDGDDSTDPDPGPPPPG
jgi:hypothetical protein